MTEISGYNVKRLVHFVDWYHRLLEEPLLKWIVRVTNLRVVSFVFNAAKWKSLSGSMQDPKLTTKQ